MNCPKCRKEMETGRAGEEPQYWWVGCDSCGLYTSARTEEELKQKLEPVTLPYSGVAMRELEKSQPQ